MEHINSTDEDQLHESSSKANDTTAFTIQNLLTPSKGYYATPILLFLNVIIFAVMALNNVDIIEPEKKDLIDWGANFRPFTLNEGLWRLVSSSFVHNGLLQFLCNMFVLISFGRVLEPLLGTVRLLYFFLLLTILSAGASLWYYTSFLSVGNSGALFGMLGIIITVYFGRNETISLKKELWIAVAVLIGFYVFYSIKGLSDNAANFSGLGGGLVFGSFFVLSTKNYSSAKSLSYQFLSMLLVLGFLIFVFQSIPSDLGKYFSKMEIITKAETEALEVYNLPQNTDNNIYLNEVQKGMEKWVQCERVIEECNQLNITDKYKSKNKLVAKYIQLRKESYELILRALQENSNKYNNEIQQYNDRILQAMKEIENFK
ncbi:MAG: rhomboid family intramembrane serine protease [Sphingobacteriaceae bacterium]|nr:rhomboid family intramembrane serine protease [Sphingobacteriaceae bacterium]